MERQMCEQFVQTKMMMSSANRNTTDRRSKLWKPDHKKAGSFIFEIPRLQKPSDVYDTLEN